MCTSRPRPSRTLLYSYELANSPGNNIVAFRLEFAPNGWFPPHRHGGASVFGHVLEGSVLNGMNSDPTTVVRKGEAWYEAPGCHHRVFENDSEIEAAVMLAVYIVSSKVLVEDGLAALVVVDEGYGG